MYTEPGLLVPVLYNVLHRKGSELRELELEAVHLIDKIALLENSSGLSDKDLVDKVNTV